MSSVNGYMTGTDDDWREVDRRPAELRAKMNVKTLKGKKEAIESNEDVKMLDRDEDRGKVDFG